jgi:hypothetical protein
MAWANPFSIYPVHTDIGVLGEEQPDIIQDRFIL